MSCSGEHSIRCFLIYSPFGPLAWPVVAHPDSSPAGRVEVYLSRKNRSGGYRAFLGCGNSGVKPSEAEDTSQISCFLVEGTMASRMRWARVLSSSFKFKEIQGLTLLPWAQKSIWGSETQFTRVANPSKRKILLTPLFPVLIIVWFISPVMLTRALSWEFILGCSPFCIHPPWYLVQHRQCPLHSQALHPVVWVIERLKFLPACWPEHCSASWKDA